MLLKMKSKILGILSILFLLVPVPSLASTDLQCWTNSATGGYSIGRRTDTYYYRYGASFTYDAGWDSIDGGSIELQRMASTDDVPLEVRIETNSASKPTGTLADLNATAIIPSFMGAGFSTKTFTFTAPVTLTPATTYWLVVKLATESGLSGDDYYRNKDDDATGSAGGGATYTTQTATWTNTGASKTQQFCLSEPDAPTSTPSSGACTSEICQSNLEHIYLIVGTLVFISALYLGYKMIK